MLQWLAFEQERVMGGIGGPRFRRLTGRPELPGRLATGAEALAVLDAAAARPRLAGRRRGRRSPTCPCSATAHVAADAGPRARARTSRAWIERIRALPGFVDDLAPYGENARPGAGRSIYG